MVVESNRKRIWGKMNWNMFEEGVDKHEGDVKLNGYKGGTNG